MSKKIDTPRPPAPEAAEQDQEASRQIWLAGLGAFAKAQQQGGKVFEALVQEGLQLQRRTQEVAQAQMAEASHKLSALTGGLSERAGQQWDRLEGIFEQRVARALQRLNVACGDEVQALRQRVDALEAQLRQARPASARAGRTARSPSQAPVRRASSRRGKPAD